jgi:hypothetical protein
VTSLDPIARVRVTPEGAEFNRFSTQILRISATPTGPSFFNTATRAHTQVIPNAVIVKTGMTRVYQEPGAPAGVVRCASDNGRQPAPYFSDPIDDLCLICPARRLCVETAPIVVISRNGGGWRVFRLDLSGDNAASARAWEQTFNVDWDLEHEADISIGLDLQRVVEVSLGSPRPIDRRQVSALRALHELLQLLPLPAATMKAVAR